MSERSKKVRNLLLSSLIAVLYRIGSWLPLPVIHFIGTGFGRLIGLFPVMPKRTTVRNIELCFPHLDQTERDRLVRRSLEETCKAFAEMGAFRFWDRSRVIGLIREERGRELLDRAAGQNKGVILLAPHLGAWELLAHYFAQSYPLTALYRPLKIPQMHRFVLEGRERLGARLASTDPAGIRSLFRALKRGEVIGILPDQDPGVGGGVFAPFFGIQANTMVLASHLARKTGAHLVVTYAERLPSGTGFRVHIREVPEEITCEDDAVAAAALNRAVETVVTEVPEQYLWSYKRFRTRPADERGGLYRRA